MSKRLRSLKAIPRAAVVGLEAPSISAGSSSEGCDCGGFGAFDGVSWCWGCVFYVLLTDCCSDEVNQALLVRATWADLTA